MTQATRRNNPWLVLKFVLEILTSYYNSTGSIFSCRVFGFLVCHATQLLALQLHPERIQVVCSNRVAQKRPTESNGTPAMDLGHMYVVLKWCICMLVAAVDLGIILILLTITNNKVITYQLFYLHIFLLQRCGRNLFSPTLMPKPPWGPDGPTPHLHILRTDLKCLPVLLFFCLFVCCYKTRKSFFASRPGLEVNPLSIFLGRVVFLRSHKRYNTAQNHSTCQMRLTHYKLTGWFASLGLCKPCRDTYESSLSHPWKRLVLILFIFKAPNLCWPRPSPKG